MVSIGNPASWFHEGVFPHLIDTAAFLDKVELGISGIRRRRPLPIIELRKSRAIGGDNRPYARSVRGECVPSGNPFEFRYGRIQSWPHLPPCRLIARSNVCPLTGTQISLIARGLMRRGYRAHVALVELTFDTSEIPIKYFEMHYLSLARYSRVLHDKTGRTTVYIGGPRSHWQVRIYQKTESVVRVEYILRSEFLRGSGIRHAEDLLQLRQLNVWNLVSFPEFSEQRLASFLRRRPNFWGRSLLLPSPTRWPLKTLATILRGRAKINPVILLRRSHAERRMRRMQHNLVW